jgi:hypothetical protein
MFTVVSVSNPHYSNAELTSVDCEVVFKEFGEGSLPFTASSNDCEAHGRALFERIVAGEFGPIAEYVPPPEPEPGPTPSSGEIPVTEA